MPAIVTLDDTQQRLIYYKFSDPLTVDEILWAYAEEQTLRDSVPHTVHSLIDMSEVTHIPPRWLAAKAGPGFSHPRAGLMMFVGLSPAVRIAVKTIVQIVRYEKIKFFETRAQADAFFTTEVLGAGDVGRSH